MAWEEFAVVVLRNLSVVPCCPVPFLIPLVPTLSWFRAAENMICCINKCEPVVELGIPAEGPLVSGLRLACLRFCGEETAVSFLSTSSHRLASCLVCQVWELPQHWRTPPTQLGLKRSHPCSCLFSTPVLQG